MSCDDDLVWDGPREELGPLYPPVRSPRLELPIRALMDTWIPSTIFPRTLHRPHPLVPHHTRSSDHDHRLASPGNWHSSRCEVGSSGPVPVLLRAWTAEGEKRVRGKNIELGVRISVRVWEALIQERQDIARYQFCPFDQHSISIRVGPRAIDTEHSLN